MPLTFAAIRSARPGSRQKKLFDGGGLFLLVTPTGGKLWRFKYRFGGKERLLAIGKYPEVSLAEARERRAELRKLLAEGIDPGAEKKALKAARLERARFTFELVAREWLEEKAKVRASRTVDLARRRLERDIFPAIGDKPIADVTMAQVQDAITRIADRGAVETAHRVLRRCRQVFAWAVARRILDQNPLRDLTADFLPEVKKGHFAATIEPAKLAELLRAIDGYDGTMVVRCALRLAPLVFVRPGELRCAKWGDVDLEATEWRYTVSKTQTQHIVPLARQAVAILREVQALTGNGPYVFPSARSPQRPMSDNAILAAMRRMGIEKSETSAHGFRTTARTILDEVLHFPPHLIEHQLAHTVRDPQGRAYNRTKHLPERKKMMQVWADYLEGLKAGAQVIPFRQLGGGR